MRKDFISAKERTALTDETPWSFIAKVFIGFSLYLLITLNFYEAK